MNALYSEDKNICKDTAKKYFLILVLKLIFVYFLKGLI